ncbi:MAG: LysR family transcriptional regulator [Planctomycetota bacterium]|nr:LysR family transcriptional regulator [Planctomycetota bacterium]
MDLYRLKSFFSVVKHGGFTAAARRLHLSQPSVSLQVKALEEALGARLLERNSKRIALTREGEVLYEIATRLFQTEDEIQEVFADRARHVTERLTVSTNQSVAAHILPPRLKKYTGRFPKVEINIHNMSTSQIVSSVKEGSTDVGIILIDPRRPGLEARPVLPYEMVLVTPRGHPLSRRRRVALGDIAKYPFISYTTDTETRQLIDQPFEKLTDKISVRMALGSTDLIITYVSLGYGISIIHNLNIDEANRENLYIRPLKRYYSRQYIHLIYRENEPFSPAVQAFCDLF